MHEVSGRRTGLFSAVEGNPVLPVRRVTFVALALALSVSELAPRLSSTGDPSQLLLRTLLSATALALSGWYPAQAGSAFALVTALGLALPPSDAELSIMLVGAYAIAVDWISRRWYLETVFLLLVVEVAQILSSPAPVADVVGLLIGVAVAVPAGLGLQRLQRRFTDLDRRAAHARDAADEARLQAEEARRRAATAEQDVRHDVAGELHSSVAQDLTKVVLLSEFTADHDLDPALREHLFAISSAAQDAAIHLRSLMAVMAANTGDHPETRSRTLEEVISTCAEMLSARRITLDAELVNCDGIGDSSIATTLLSGIIEEGCMNILKYAVRGSMAHVTISQTDDAITSISMSNEIEDQHQPSTDPRGISGSIGLSTISERVESYGGTVRYGAANGTWLLTAILPSSPTLSSSPDRTPVSGPTTPMDS